MTGMAAGWGSELAAQIVKGKTALSVVGPLLLNAAALLEKLPDSLRAQSGDGATQDARAQSLRGVLQSILTAENLAGLDDGVTLRVSRTGSVYTVGCKWGEGPYSRFESWLDASLPWAEVASGLRERVTREMGGYARAAETIDAILVEAIRFAASGAKIQGLFENVTIPAVLLLHEQTAPLFRARMAAESERV